MKTQFETLKIAVEGSAGVITISRPQAMNALSNQTLEDLSDAIEQLRLNASVRGIVITGEGKAFVAGADIAQMQPYGALEGHAYAEKAQSVFTRIERLEKPVIAAVNGYALGGGCELALSCDIRIASEKAVFGQPEVNLGVVPCFGGTQRLPRVVGVGMAKEIMFTGRMVKAEEAAAIRLVNRVVAPDALLNEAKALIEQIGEKGPIAVAYTKAAINKSMDLDMDSGLEVERALSAITFATEDKQEGMDAFLEKRTAKFQNK